MVVASDRCTGAVYLVLNAGTRTSSIEREGHVSVVELVIVVLLEMTVERKTRYIPLVMVSL
jgi:hypothetical protein